MHDWDTFIGIFRDILSAKERIERIGTEIDTLREPNYLIKLRFLVANLAFERKELRRKYERLVEIAQWAPGAPSVQVFYASLALNGVALPILLRRGVLSELSEEDRTRILELASPASVRILVDGTPSDTFSQDALIHLYEEALKTFSKTPTEETRRFVFWLDAKMANPSRSYTLLSGFYQRHRHFHRDMLELLRELFHKHHIPQ